MAATAVSVSHAAAPWPRSRTRGHPDAHHAASVSDPSSMKVFTRCSAIHGTRLAERFSATRSSLTSAAPTSASLTRKQAESAAPVRTGLPRGCRRQASTTSASTKKPSAPVISRCVNSISVWTEGDGGITSPLQRGQWLPHPAPAPVARTRAPQSTTATFHASTAQQ